MADLVQTPANVAVGSQTAKTELVQYGEAISAGMPIYKSGAKWYKCIATDVIKAACGAIALTSGALDSYGVIVKPSTTPGQSLVNLGATLAVGETYAVSATLGAISTIGGILSTQYTTPIGIAKTAALLDFQVIIANTAKA